MTNPHQHWRKSSHSQATANCVELSSTMDELRDSKDPNGPTLHINVHTLIKAIKTGRFDHTR